MDEYIKREDAIEAIRKQVTGVPATFLVSVNNAINSVAAADVAPVVRCKDCKHYIKSMMLCKKESGLDTPDKMDSCSYGERIVE